MANDSQDGELFHSEEVEEIISAPPPWLLLWGVTSIIVVLLLLFGLSGLIESPEIVTGNLRINEGIARNAVVSPREGVLRILVDEKDVVSQGQILGFIESRHDPLSLLKLSHAIDSLHKRLLSGDLNYKGINLDLNGDYGELQTSVLNFHSEGVRLNAYYTEGLFKKKIDLLRQELSYREKLNDRLLSQRPILSDTNNLYIEQQLTNPASLLSLQIELVKCEKEVQERKLLFLTHVQAFKDKIDSLKAKTILTATHAGKIILSQSVYNKKRVPLGSTIMWIKNQDSRRMYGELTIGSEYVLDMKEGQEILINIKNYPIQTYGYLKAKVGKKIASISEDSIQRSELIFPEGFLTSRKYDLNLESGFATNASVTINRKSLLSRMAGSLANSLSPRVAVFPESSTKPSKLGD